MTEFIRWQGADGDFAGWQVAGTRFDAAGALCLDPTTAAPGQDPYPPGTYHDRNFYNGGSYVVGEAVSPVCAAKAYFEALASWNADTPEGSWLESLIRARVAGRWTKWYHLGVWASGAATVERHSVNGQKDADGNVSTDTLLLSSANAPADAFQLKFRLFSADGRATPRIRNASVATSGHAARPTSLLPGDPASWDILLDAPQCSQMVYPDGGDVWCSPTSVVMALAYWQRLPESCEPGVRAAAEGVYDWLYQGQGNWSFNTAYAATFGMEAFVTRFDSLSQAEAWIAEGMPVIVSFAWGKDELAGAPIPSSNGHLALLVGFDAAGSPIINDPAAATNDAVRRIYDRVEFESLWLEHSGGAVYLIYPEGHPTPMDQ
jgi:hypothetical protein